MYKKQQGLTMISWAVVVAFIGIILVSALNVIPSYLNFFTAKSILGDISTSAEVKGKTPKEIKTTITKHFKMNNIRIPVKDAVTFKNKGASSRAGYTVFLKYEDRGKILGNLYFVTAFEHEVEFAP